MTATNALQMAAVVSVSTPPPVIGTRALQMAVVYSVSTIPSARALQLSAIISVSPGKALLHPPQRMETNGPLNLAIDQPKLGDK